MINFYEKIPKENFNTSILDRKITEGEKELIIQGMYRECIDSKTIIMCDITKINSEWKQTNQYLPPYNLLEDNNWHKEKYVNSRKELFNLKLKSPPRFCYDKHKKQYTILNGVHRFSNMRDLGFTKIPICIDRTQYRYFIKFL